MIIVLSIVATVLLALVALLLYLGTVKIERGEGSWSNTYGEFDVATLELYFGGYYVEIVWGWWPKRR